MTTAAANQAQRKGRFPAHGWIGLGLTAVFWAVNWLGSGSRTLWAFFPMWLGYCLVVDALTFLRSGTSLLTRSWKSYTGLFFVSAPGWWLFELLNQRVQNWHYLGGEQLTSTQYFLFATINFSIVIPAVFGAAEFFTTFPFIRNIKPWVKLKATSVTTRSFFIAGLVMLLLLMIWPRYFFPFLWLSVLFILEPINVWLGNPSMSEHTGEGDWRPVISLFCGVLLTGFFWEMWNFFSFPKWIYSVPGVNFGHIFEMPILGYGGYLPFSLELFALYQLVMGMFKHPQAERAHLRIKPDSEF